tara:strand:- start:220 stop:753 length:534 start_codon:yes stop_codon:yes gene_type:complete
MSVALGARKDGQKIEIVSDGPDKLSITLDGDPGQLNKYFSLHLVDVESDILDLSTKGDSQVDLTLTTRKMQELVTQLQLFDSVVKAEFGEELVSFEAKGDQGGLRVDVSLEDVVEYAIAGALKQEFSLAYMQTMCGFGKLCDEVAMQFSEDRPMEATYDLGDDSRVSLYLAPKVAAE